MSHTPRFIRSTTSGTDLGAPAATREPTPEDSGNVFGSRDWAGPQAAKETSMLVHWVDEKGSVVRLISSSNHLGGSRGDA